MQVSITRMYLGGKKKYTVIVCDISAKEASKALRRVAEERRRTYYANAAHELRSPLGSILGFANMLAKRRLPDETVSEVAGIMSTETTRLVKLIDEMLDFAELESNGSNDFNTRVQPLGPVIETTLLSLGGMAGIERVVVHPAQAIPDVAIDASKMQQALTNIISNAIKYSPDGGQIDITLHALHTGQGQVVQLAVADRGIGMTPAQTIRIFEPFYRARHLPSAEGSGLGMTITRELIACQNGAISVESVLGKGTKVRIDLPLRRNEGGSAVI
jgi:signal transduction histidine kinase